MQSKLTRRAVLAGIPAVAAIAAGAAMPSEVVTGDEHLLDLERRGLVLRRRRLEIIAECEKLGMIDDDPEEERLYDLCFDLEKEIAKAPAHTAAGVAVKIRLLQESYEQDWDVYYADGFRTALEALERLAGGAS